MKGAPSTSWTRRAARISAHWHFSEDTYLTLTAAPHPNPPPRAGASGGGLGRGLLDAAPKSTKPGIEEQTRKLFEVCRLRDVPIITLSTSSTASAVTRSTSSTKSSSHSRST